MASVEMVMPKMGESVMEGTILKWLKQEGEVIALDEPVLEVATDKVDTEIPAPFEGILEKILAQEGEVVPIGNPIALIATEAAQSTPAPSLAPVQPEEKSEKSPLEQVEASIAEAQNYALANGQNLAKPADDRFYSPLVMSIARQENIPMAELALIPGTGLEQRVTKKDIISYLSQRKNTPVPLVEKPVSPSPTPTPTAVSPTPVPASTGAISGNVEIIEMDRMRRMIADRMVESKRISPHVTTFVEVDVSNIVRWRDKVKKEFEKREGEKLTFTPIFIEALAKTLRDFPMVNISVEGDKILLKKDIHIGMATALPSGNLIVPVIHHADQYNLVGLAKKVNDLANRARQNKLKPDELSGGTYSVSNIGSFGNEMGTPIIMQPQVAIMAIGAIKKKPAVLETEAGDVIAIRNMMFISHSYDHRVVDGALGGSFARRFADYLEAFDINRAI
ncbi:MAG: dihydrolipoamide acetyltransferase family protein [Microscillaceae bacterium]